MIDEKIEVEKEAHREREWKEMKEGVDLTTHLSHNPPINTITGT